MNINQVGGGAAFFGVGFFQGATQQIQQAPFQQVQQLQQLMQAAFQNFFQAANQFPSMGGAGFAQSPAATPGFIQPPGPNTMFPSNPTGQMNFAGGFAAGGFMIGGGFGGGFGQVGGGFGGGFGQVGVGGGFGQIGTPMPPPQGIKQSGENPPEFTTPGGYKVRAEGKDAGWTVTSPEGKTTRIWGDPHVQESDGGKWDFKKDMSFVLPDGTKITAKTTPPLANGYTVTDSIDIMNGDQRASISGIAANKPQTEGIKNDRWAVDARTPDGDYAVLNKAGDAWFLNGKNEIIGSEKQGEILKTRAGGDNTGITPLAQQAMQEAQPPFGGQQFLAMMLQQMLQTIMQQLQQFGGGGGGFSIA